MLNVDTRSLRPLPMSMRRLIPLAVVASLLPIAEASATGGRSSIPFPRFTIKSSNGYSIQLGRIDQEIVLVASHGGRSYYTWAGYSAPGSVTSERVNVRFGRLGRVSVRFEAKGKPKKMQTKDDCFPEPIEIRFGTFVGKIMFRGEGGYTEVDAERAKGRVEIYQRRKCLSARGSARSAAAPELSPPTLKAGDSRHRFFTVSGFKRSDGKDAIDFAAFSYEHRRRLSISRFVRTSAPPDTYGFSENLGSATVRPPWPFQGEATFQRKPKGGSSWIGDLSASFPGQDHVSLAGPRFSVKLKQETGEFG